RLIIASISAGRPFASTTFQPLGVSTTCQRAGNRRGLSSPPKGGLPGQDQVAVRTAHRGWRNSTQRAAGTRKDWSDCTTKLVPSSYRARWFWVPPLLLVLPAALRGSDSDLRRPEQWLCQEQRKWLPGRRPGRKVCGNFPSGVPPKTDDGAGLSAL